MTTALTTPTTTATPAAKKVTKNRKPAASKAKTAAASEKVATKATAATVDREALRAAVEDLADALVNGSDDHLNAYIAELAQERTRGYLAFGMYKPWSINNTWYLQSQVRRRQATTKSLYAGVKQWRERGRAVIDGEKPFVIYGPPAYAGAANAGAQPAPAATPAATPAPQINPVAVVPAPAVRAAVGFFRRPPIIEVFDWTQTVSTDPDFVEPDWAVPLATGTIATLDALIASSPVPVTLSDLRSRSEHGWIDASGITVDSSQATGNTIFTLVHELAHHHLNHLADIADTTGTPNASEVSSAEGDPVVYTVRAVCEQEAALTQFLVMKMLGLDESVGNDLTTAAGAYLRSWTRTTEDGSVVPLEGHKGRRKLLATRFNAAMKAADKIVMAFLATRDGAITPTVESTTAATT